MGFRWHVIALFVLCLLCCASGFIPILHEVVTSFHSLGHAIAGNPQAARNCWQTYAEESIIGSGIYSAVTALSGDVDRATGIARGMGRATGKALVGGGILKDVPVFHELATVGESLGDVLGGGDTESARLRWDSYANSSLLGSGVVAAGKFFNGDPEGAKAYGKAALVAGSKFAVNAAVVAVTAGVTVATGGLSTVAAVAISSVTGGAAFATSTAVKQAMSGEEINAGDVIGSGLLGATTGGVFRYVAPRGAPAAKTGSALARSETEAVLPRSSSGDLAQSASRLSSEALTAAAAAEADTLSAASTPRSFRTSDSTPRSFASSGASGLRAAGEPMADIARAANGVIDVDPTGGGVFRPQGEVVRVPISRLVHGRDSLDPQRLEVCRQAYRQGVKYPPIKVAQQHDGRFKIIDGHHRVAALKEHGRDNINAVVVSGA